VTWLTIEFPPETPLGMELIVRFLEAALERLCCYLGAGVCCRLGLLGLGLQFELILINNNEI